MGTFVGIVLALFALWLSVVVRNTPDDAEEWDDLLNWGVFLQFVIWVVLLFSVWSVVDTTT